MRAVLALLCAFALPLFAAERVITPDWSLASSLTAMGFPPLAMGDKRIYPVWMSDPVQPPSVVDLGERYRPNRKLLAQLPFSRVVDNFFYAHLREVYPPSVPVVDVLFDGGNEAPQQSWATYVAATQKLGDAIGERAAAEGYLQRMEAALAGYGREIRAAAPEVKRYAVVQFADARQLRIFAPNSLFRVAFALMGLEQADLGAGNRWGFAGYGLVIGVVVVVAVLFFAKLRVVVDGGEGVAVEGFCECLQRREGFAARHKFFAFLRPAGDAVVGTHQMVAVVVGEQHMDAAVLGQVADGIAAVRFGGERQSGGGAGVFADVGERDAFCLGGDAVGVGIGGGVGATCGDSEEEGEGVAVHGFLYFGEAEGVVRMPGRPARHPGGVRRLSRRSRAVLRYWGSRRLRRC